MPLIRHTHTHVGCKRFSKYERKKNIGGNIGNYYRYESICDLRRNCHKSIIGRIKSEKDVPVAGRQRFMGAGAYALRFSPNTIPRLRSKPFIDTARVRPKRLALFSRRMAEGKISLCLVFLRWFCLFFVQYLRSPVNVARKVRTFKRDPMIVEWTDGNARNASCMQRKKNP